LGNTRSSSAIHTEYEREFLWAWSFLLFGGKQFVKQFLEQLTVAVCSVRLVAGVTKPVKTSLHSITGMMEILRRDANRSAEVRSYRELIEAELRRLVSYPNRWSIPMAA
jgi:hypothetical protein